MIYIGITKKIKDKFKLTTVKIEDVDQIDKLNAWHANLFISQRKTGVIFMNDLTRYSVILFGLKKADFNNLETLMKTQLKKNMLSNGFNDFSIHKFTKTLDEITFTGTSSRSILGQIKDSLFALTFYIYPDDILTEDLIQEVNDRTNKTPMEALKRDGFKQIGRASCRERV